MHAVVNDHRNADWKWFRNNTLKRKKLLPTLIVKGESFELNFFNWFP